MAKRSQNKKQPAKKKKAAKKTSKAPKKKAARKSSTAAAPPRSRKLAPSKVVAPDEPLGKPEDELIPPPLRKEAAPKPLQAETIEQTSPAPDARRTERASGACALPRPSRRDLEKEISKLIAVQGTHPDEDLISDMILTSLRTVRDGCTRLELKIMAAALREFRYAFHVFRPYQDVRKVSVFGSARSKPTTPEYKQAFRFSAEMVRRGYMVITGAGPGIMEAAQGGAGREQSFGVNIRLPFEQSANPYIEGDPKLIHFRYFFTRKLFFVKEAHAITLFPGGFGTHDEGFEALTLIQTGKASLIPMIFVDKPGGSYWREWQDYVVEHLLGMGLISEDDMHLFKVTDDPIVAADEVTNFYRRYHSSRFVNDRLVLRLLTPLPEGKLDELNEKYQSILRKKSPGIQAIKALPQERDEPELMALPRLRLNFNRRSFGMLRRMIDEINDA